MRRARAHAHHRFMQSDTMQSAPGERSTVWAHMFARTYDAFLWAGERACVRALRNDLLTSARGCTLEIGAGTGLNVPHYPIAVDDLHLLEPDATMRTRLEKKVRGSARPVRIIDGSVEQLPFADASVDTVVSTLVLCTVDAPDVALREIKRVLRPDGRLLFLEHVRSDSPRLARRQDRFMRPWRRFARGCRCNRATVELMSNCGFTFPTVHEATWRAMPSIVKPLVAGEARIGHGNA
jgi:ubiquinone/menaquinone biosynthesis C-methylase UbiE